ncbi:MAG: DUF4268 domain-containing protein [Ferruginibacter sp.]
MYSRQETSLLTQQFWTTFGGYLAPVLSAEEKKINWVNYKTGEKDIRFILMADNKSAKISITLSHKDTALQQLHFEKLIQLKKILEQFTNEVWQGDLLTTDQHGKSVSSIYTTLQRVNVLNKADWPAIISFLKPRMIALDKFWCEYKYAFERPAF